MQDKIIDKLKQDGFRHSAGQFRNEKENKMDCEKLKNILAGIGLAGLVAGAGLTSPGYVQGSSG